jgi:hypothetical protein
MGSGKNGSESFLSVFVAVAICIQCDQLIDNIRSLPAAILEMMRLKGCRCSALVIAEPNLAQLFPMVKGVELKKLACLRII